MPEIIRGSLVDAIIAQTAEGPIVSRIKPGVINPGSPGDLLERASGFAKDRLRKVTIIPENPKKSKWARTLPMLDDDFRVRHTPLTGKIVIVSYQPDSVDSELLKERWNTFQNVEDAIRYTTRVQDDHEIGGKETLKMQALTDVVSSTYGKIESNELKEGNVDEFLQEVSTLLESSGILKARAANRKALAEQLKKIIRKIRNRDTDNLIQQTILASSVIKILVENMIDDKVVAKYSEIGIQHLMTERYRERISLESVVKNGERFLEIPEDFEDIKRHMQRFETFANIFLDLDKIIVSPYKNAAVFFLTFMFGYPENRSQAKGRKRLIASMNSPEVVQMLDDIHNGEGAEDSNSPEVFRRRLTIGLEILNNVLEQGERNLESKTV